VRKWWSLAEINGVTAYWRLCGVTAGKGRSDDGETWVVQNTFYFTEPRTRMELWCIYYIHIINKYIHTHIYIYTAYAKSRYLSSSSIDISKFDRSRTHHSMYSRLDFPAGHLLRSPAPTFSSRVLHERPTVAPSTGTAHWPKPIQTIYSRRVQILALHKHVGLPNNPFHLGFAIKTY